MPPPTASRSAQLELWTGRTAWVGLGIEAVLWIALWDLSVGSLAHLWALGSALALGTAACAVCLVVRYRKLAGTWGGLGGLVLTLPLLLWAQEIPAPGALAALRMMTTIGLYAALPASMILLLIRRDVSVPLIGLALLAFLWGVLLASRSYGGPIQALVQYWGALEKHPFWWLQTLTCLLGLTLPVGGAAFVFHLVRLLIREFRGT